MLTKVSEGTVSSIWFGSCARSGSDGIGIPEAHRSSFQKKSPPGVRRARRKQTGAVFFLFFVSVKGFLKFLTQTQKQMKNKTAPVCFRYSYAITPTTSAGAKPD